MPLNRDIGRPHVFNVQFAVDYGVNAAVVQAAIQYIESMGNRTSTDLSEVMDYCNYLTEEEVRQAYKVLLDNHCIEELEQ